MLFDLITIQKKHKFYYIKQILNYRNMNKKIQFVFMYDKYRNETKFVNGTKI